MIMPKSPYDTTLAESWLWAINDFEWSLALAESHERDRRMVLELMRNLRPLIDLTRQLASSKYGQFYRAGTSLRMMLLISTAARHHLEPDEPFIRVSVECLKRDVLGFRILYFEGGEWNRHIEELIKSYETDDYAVIEANLRRDLPNFYYSCEYAAAWETLEPLMMRLWKETHSDGSGVGLLPCSPEPFS